MNTISTLNVRSQQSQVEPISNSTKLIPLTSWSLFHPWPSVSGLRYWVFHSETNGFNKVIRRVGKRILIDEAAFFDWVNSQQGEA